MRRKWYISGFLVTLALLISSALVQAPSTLSQAPEPSTKVSSLLSLQVNAKKFPPTQPNEVNILQAESAGGPQSVCAIESNNQATALDWDLTRPRIFIYLNQKPNQAQIAELQALGITLYLDSWVPPVGAHTAGFLLAEMPIDKVNDLAAKDYVVRLDTAEQSAYPQNDLATAKINADDVRGFGYTGSGVNIAILDSGLDLNHPDIPTPIAQKDYSAYPTLDNTIGNTVSGHGTHVTGCALGRGTQSGGRYRGSAPAANLTFLKIGRDSDGAATVDAMVYALRAAADNYTADIITMSYGRWDSYHDGTSAEAQAVDYAFSRGAVVFISAGNEANKGRHYFNGLMGWDTSDFIQVNVTGAGFNDTGLYFNLVCDNVHVPGVHNALSLLYYDSDKNLLFGSDNVTTSAQSESPRGTESQYSYYKFYVPSGNSTWYLKVTNNSGNNQSYHIYERWGARVTFQVPAPNFTITTPADADNAIAVGAYTVRNNWTDYKGASTNSGQTIDTVATYSSEGGRLGHPSIWKPNIVAPGGAIISCRDEVYVIPAPAYDYLVIDNDGLNLDGSGPADYLVMEGTSMAAPHAAGAAALLLQAHPEWRGNPATVRSRLQETAFSGPPNPTPNFPNDIYGYGLIDVQKALGTIVSTQAPMHIDANQAYLRGSLFNLGAAATANVTFQWGTTPGVYPNESPPEVMDETGNFSFWLTGLNPATTYYFRAKGVGDLTHTGEEWAFITTTAPPVQTYTATGTGIAIFSSNLGNIANLTAVAEATLPTAGKPAGVSFPHGLFSFNIVGIAPGSCVTVTITYPVNLPLDTQYWKCQNGNWVDCTSLLGYDYYDNVLTLTICDGGLGDADGVVNGTIVDPGGPATAAAAPTPNPRASATPPRPLNPAQMAVKYLSVSPQQTTAGQPVTILTNVVNTGNEAGNYNVALKINGQVEQSRMVSVGPQGTQPVKFTVTKAQPGTYTVNIGDQKSSFIVTGAGSRPSAEMGEGLLFVAAMAVIAILVVLLITVARRRLQGY